MRELERIKTTRVRPVGEIDNILEERGSAVFTAEASLEQLLKRPELGYGDIAGISAPLESLKPEAAEQVEIQVKYEGYIQRQMNQVERFASLEKKDIPPDLDYDGITGLGSEVKQKLQQVRPISLGQASRISGVTPAAISLMMVALEKRKRGRDAT